MVLHRYSDGRGRAALMFNLFDANGDGELTIDEVCCFLPLFFLPDPLVLSVWFRICAWLTFQMQISRLH